MYFNVENPNTKIDRSHLQMSYVRSTYIRIQTAQTLQQYYIVIILLGPIVDRTRDKRVLQ